MKLLREPLVHFLLLGAVLFGVFALLGDRGSERAGHIADTVNMSPKDKWFRAYAVQQLSLSPELVDFTIRYHVVLSTRQRTNVFSSEHREQIADMVRQAAVPFEQTTAHVLWLASDHMHLYIDATPDYSLDESEYRKIKWPFPSTASAHPMPPCCHPARCCPRLGSARTPRASGWPALDTAGRPPARTAAHGQDGWLGTGSRHGWSCSGGGCRG